MFLRAIPWRRLSPSAPLYGIMKQPHRSSPRSHSGCPRRMERGSTRRTRESRPPVLRWKVGDSPFWGGASSSCQARGIGSIKGRAVRANGFHPKPTSSRTEPFQSLTWRPESWQRACPASSTPVPVPVLVHARGRRACCADPRRPSCSFGTPCAPSLLGRCRARTTQQCA